ncbi:MAG: amylo-alpha-1,6-glucosidase, partial [candidate division NC10 bacterium]
QFYILASSLRTQTETRSLKSGETFAVFDDLADIQPVGLGQQGLYHRGTRFLSRLELRMGDSRPLLLSSTVKEDNGVVAADLANPDIMEAGRRALAANTVHVSRTAVLVEGACYQRLRIRNYGTAAVDLPITFEFDADFRDIFEVRGLKRAKRGRTLPAETRPEEVLLGYEGRDGLVRRTRVRFEPTPDEISSGRVTYTLSIPPKDDISISVAITCEQGDWTPRRVGYEQAVLAAGNKVGRETERACGIHTSNDLFNNWVSRSRTDLGMLLTEKSEGPYPYAGIPWFSTPFGRDGIITALQMLWLDPEIAKGVLGYLAETQASQMLPEQDAEPGKILHEAREGELAALGEIPFRQYYGAVDTTPLFVLLAGAYYERTGHQPFIEKIWPHVVRALEWIDRHGDRDGDGFVEYERRAPSGLTNQGWKDSEDAVFHADGRAAEGPIALCEVQAYVFAAKQSAARLARGLGETDLAQSLDEAALALQDRFSRSFWSDELGTFVLALDGNKRPCEVRTSNAGHCLYAGIASPEQAQAVAAVLMSDEMCSRWGIRTLASCEERFNPMSYHNGSVWPHDNALIANGLARYMLKDGVTRIFTQLFDACLFMDLHRLPELYCGFPRRSGEGPTRYPVACAPQAWASASVFSLLQACLGLTISRADNRIAFFRPVLPPFLERVSITNIRVGDSTLDIEFHRHAEDVGIQVVRRDGDAQVLVVK